MHKITGKNGRIYVVLNLQDTIDMLNGAIPIPEEDCILEIVEDCPFCDSHTTWIADEHYLSCGECKAEWSHLIVFQGCEHIEEESNPPTVFNASEKNTKNPICILEDEDGNQTCSECGKKVLADGW
jgi:hypothetical protein